MELGKAPSRQRRNRATPSGLARLPAAERGSVQNALCVATHNWHAPMQLVIAVSDGGRIRRLDGWKPPEKPFRVFVKKADLVPEQIEEELGRHRIGANPLHVRPVGAYGIWGMTVEEVPRVAKFLAERHVDRPAKSKRVGRSDAAAKQRRYSKTRRHYPNAWDPWHPEDDRELLRLHKQGWDNEKLAQRFGRRPNAIKSRLRKLEG